MTQRFPLLAQPPASPACCAACRRPSDKIGFFDTGLELDFWGRVYLCATDLLEMVAGAAAALGLVGLGELEREQSARRSAEKALAAANAGEAAARRVLAEGALAMIQRVTVAHLQLEMANRPEGESDAGSGPDAGAAGGGGAGSGGDDGGVPAGRPVRRPARPRRGSPAGSADADGGGPLGPAAEPAAGGDGGRAAEPGPADGDLAGASAGA